MPIVGDEFQEGVGFFGASPAASQVDLHRLVLVKGITEYSLDVCVQLVEALVAGQVRAGVQRQAVDQCGKTTAGWFRHGALQLHGVRGGQSSRESSIEQSLSTPALNSDEFLPLPQGARPDLMNGHDRLVSPDLLVLTPEISRCWFVRGGKTCTSWGHQPSKPTLPRDGIREAHQRHRRCQRPIQGT